MLTYSKEVNPELLRAELDDALGGRLVGVSYTSSNALIRINAEEGSVLDDHEATITAVIDGHDPELLTPGQLAVLDASFAPVRAAAIPGWATWDEDQAVEYIDDNVTDLPSAKVVLKAMARLLVALRDAQWPGLGG